MILGMTTDLDGEEGVNAKYLADVHGQTAHVLVPRIVIHYGEVRPKQTYPQEVLRAHNSRVRPGATGPTGVYYLPLLHGCGALVLQEFCGPNPHSDYRVHGHRRETNRIQDLHMSRIVMGRLAVGSRVGRARGTHPVNHLVGRHSEAQDSGLAQVVDKSAVDNRRAGEEVRT